VENSLQLGIYHMAAIGIYKWARTVVSTFDMVRHGRFTTVFPTDKLADMRSYLINLWHQIQNAPVPLPRLNQYCNWCHKRGNCPVYQRALEDTIQPILTEEYDNPEGMEFIFDQWTELKNRKKVIEGRLEELGSMLSAVVIQADGSPVRIGDREIYLSPNSEQSYPADKVYELFAKKRALVMLRTVMSIQKGAMDRALKSIPFAPEVEKLLVRSFKKSSLKVRSLKPEAVEEE
jgi:hypothetical protein